MSRINERARATVAAPCATGSVKAYHGLFVARAALGLVMVSVAMAGAVASRVGLFDHPYTQLSFGYIAEISVLIAFLFAMWWRIPWYASASILGLLYVLSGFERQSAQALQIANTSIAVVAGMLVQRLSIRRAAVSALGRHEDFADAAAADAGARRRIAHLHGELARAQAANRDLTARNEHLQEFTASASHDLKAPLRAIRGYGNLLLEDHGEELTPAAAGYVERMLDSTTRLEHLVDALLELGRVSRCKLQRQRIDLAALARDIVADLRAGSPRRKVQVIVADRIEADGDPVLVRIALTNLLSNAWKFTAPSDDARIEIGVARRDGAAAFYVRDNGVGFDGARAEAIFRPFERLNASVKFEGSGVGLATVARVIERHGGRVWAQGSRGRGATIFFTLPCR